MNDKNVVLSWIGIGMFVCWVILFICLLSFPSLSEFYKSIKLLIPEKLYDICLLLYVIIMTIFIFYPLLQTITFRILLGMLILEYISLWWRIIFDPSGLIFKFQGQLIHDLHFIYIHVTNLCFVLYLLFEAIKSMRDWKKRS